MVVFATAAIPGLLYSVSVANNTAVKYVLQHCNVNDRASYKSIDTFIVRFIYFVIFTSPIDKKTLPAKGDGR